MSIIGKEVLVEYTHSSFEDWEFKETHFKFTGKILDKFKDGKGDLYLVEVLKYYEPKELNETAGDELRKITPHSVVKTFN